MVSRYVKSVMKELTFSVIARRIVRPVLRSIVFCGITTDLELKFRRHSELIFDFYRRNITRTPSRMLGSRSV